MAEITNTYGYDTQKLHFFSAALLPLNSQDIFFGTDELSPIFFDSNNTISFLISGTPGVTVAFGSDQPGLVVFAKNPAFAGATIDSLGFSAPTAYQFWS